MDMGSARTDDWGKEGQPRDMLRVVNIPEGRARKIDVAMAKRATILYVCR
jgi:hypothetical protein